ncbi:MAG: hypothetical protein ABF258_08400, partial [Flavobacteriales bacterium]
MKIFDDLFLLKLSRILAVIFILFWANDSVAQNIGIGTTTPTHSFHIVRAPGNPNPDPLRIENLAVSNSDTSFLVVDNNGVVRYMNLGELRRNVSGNLDSLIIATLITNADTLFSSASFSDSLRGFIYNNADTLFSNRPWLDSLSVLLKDSIDSDVDSLVISPLDSLYLYEDGKRISVYLPDLDVTNELLDSIYIQGDSIVLQEGTRTHYLKMGAFVDSLETVTTLTSTDSTLTYVDEDGISTVINIKAMIDSSETVTSISFTDSTITYIDEDGISSVINVGAMIDSMETVTTMIDNGNGTFTYTNEDGVTFTFNARDTVITSLVDNGDSTFTYTNEAGLITTIDFRTTGAVTTVTNNNDGTFTYLNELGNLITIDTKDTNTTAFGQVGDSVYYVDGFGDTTKVFVNNDTVITTLIDNGNGTFTYTSEDGTTTI